MSNKTFNFAEECEVRHDEISVVAAIDINNNQPHTLKSTIVWHDISEEKPIDRNDYLIVTKDGQIAICYYMEDISCDEEDSYSIFSYYDYHYDIDEVSLWAELPKIPRKEDKQ